jgi:hypothetical protein
MRTMRRCELGKTWVAEDASWIIFESYRISTGRGVDCMYDIVCHMYLNRNYG